MKSETLLLIGGGEHAGVVFDAALCDARRSWKSICYVSPDDGKGAVKTLQRIGTDQEGLKFSRNADVVLAIGAVGMSDFRERMFNLYDGGVKAWATVIHEKAILSRSATVGSGSVVLAGAIIGAGATVGRQCIVNSNSVIEHDVHLGDFVTIGPSVAIGGGVGVGARASIGIGAMIRDHVMIGESACIGMGAVVTKDVAPGETVLGNPAKVIEK